MEATTRPLVLLTSNNTRELTEALKRRCLYLWLDYPDAERELEIVRLHVPELPETITRRLIEIIRMVRSLDLKKPPSIAESIDWAQALILLGATDIDRSLFERDEHHREAPHRPRRGRRARGRETRRWPLRSPGAGNRGSLYGGLPDGVPDGLAPQLVRFCEELRAEGVARPSCSTPSTPSPR